MLERIPAWALNNRFFILCLTLLMIGFGLYSTRQLSIDAVPDVTNVQVTINTNAPALSPLEIEQQITFTIEQVLNGIPGVEQIRSISLYGLSQVTVVFKEGTDIYFARQLVGERLQGAVSQLPAGLEPQMGPIATGLGEIYQYQLRGENLDLSELRTLQDWVVKRQLQTVEGVAEVSSQGGDELQYEVLLDPDKLFSFQLSPEDVFRALTANSENAGTGFLESAGERSPIRVLGQLQDPDKIGRIVIAVRDKVPILIDQVATVKAGAAPKFGSATRDGTGEIVTGTVLMLVGQNSRKVAYAVERKVQDINKSLPNGVSVEPYYNRTDLINLTIGTVFRNLAEGALLVVVVLMLTLGDLRAALIVGLAIPLSMLFAVSLMVKMGISGNLMSLGAIDFGLLVDGSVVMVENIVAKLESKKLGSLLDLSRKAATEVARPVALGLGIIIVVYLPILTLTGVEGKMFRPMAQTVVFALIGSLLVALLITPVLGSLFLRIPKGQNHEGSRLIKWAQIVYRPLLIRSLKVPLPLSLLAVLGFVLGLWVLPRLGAEFIPELDEGALAIEVVRLPGSSLPQSIEMTGRLEQELLKFPEVSTVVSKIGRSEEAFDPMGVERSDVMVLLKPRDEWRFSTQKELLESISDEFADYPGMQLGFSQPIKLRVDELIAGVRADVAVKIFGDDLQILKNTADQMAAKLASVPGAADVKVEQLGGSPYLLVDLDRSRLARFGLSTQQVQDVLDLTLGQRQAAKIYQGDRRFDIVTRLDEESRQSVEAVGRILVATPTGEYVQLKDIAQIDLQDGLTQVSRENGQRRLIVQANVRGRDLVGFVTEAKRALDGLAPEGYFVEWGGQFENYDRARNRLLLVVPLALILIFLLLYATFNSALQSALVFTNVPLALTGGVLALFSRGLPFSISAGIGFIALFGIAVLNGVVLVSHINELRESGKSLYFSVRKGTQSRLRPVLTTALVAGLGFLPMALSTGAGAEVQRPLATVVIGGLITSTILTLLVLPSIYLWCYRQKWRRPVADPTCSMSKENDE
jgi:heavy metal efflux system protein